MNNFFETYEIVLKTVGPVFIGSGREISKKEYAILDKETLAVLKTAEFYSKAESLGLKEDLEKFILSNQSSNIMDWVFADESTKRDKAQLVKDCIKYELKCKQLIEDREDRSSLQILEFVRDPYGMPYIPGSSLKGMLRTILISYHIIKNSNLYKNKERENSIKIENIALSSYNGLTEDNLKGFRVSDSKPLSNDDLTLSNTVELRVDGNHKTLPVLKESIKPETDIYFNLTIDTSTCKITKDTLLNAISEFAAQYNLNYGNKFISKVDAMKDSQVIIGGGGGFVSKTIIYPLLGKDKGLRQVSNMFVKSKGQSKYHKHDKDVELGVSPHILKCTDYFGKLLKMGLCEVSILDKGSF